MPYIVLKKIMMTFLGAFFNLLLQNLSIQNIRTLAEHHQHHHNLPSICQVFEAVLNFRKMPMRL